MVDFDELNRETREWSNSGKGLGTTPTTSTYSTRFAARYEFGRKNNETYKQNNGQYSPRYY